MKTTVTKFDFDFTQLSYGLYKVIFTSPKGKKYMAKVDDMCIIDRVKNTEEPLKKDLNTLKSICKESQKQIDNLK
jgi:hypothetical protein